MKTSLVIASYASFAVLSTYLLIRIRREHLIYVIAIGLMLVGTILGFLFRVLHLPDWIVLSLIGLSGTALGAILLVWRSFRNKQDQFIMNKLLAGVMILVRIMLALFLPEHAAKISLLNYTIAAFTATVIIYEQYEHDGEKGILMLFLLQSFFYILIELVSLT